MLDATDFGTTIVPTTPTAAHLQSVLAPLSFKSTTDALLPDRPATVEVIGVPLKNETVPRWRPPIADAVVVGAKKSAAASTSPTARVSPPPRRKPADVTLPLQDVPKSLAKQLEEKVALARVMYRNQLEGTERDGEPANAWKDHESLPFTMVRTAISSFFLDFALMHTAPMSPPRADSGTEHEQAQVFLSVSSSS